MVNDASFVEEKRMGDETGEEGIDEGEGGVERSAASVRRLTVVKSPLVPTRELFFRIHTGGLMVVRTLPVIS